MDAQQIKHFAKLARIGVTDTEADVLAKDVSRILSFIDTLQTVAPDMAHISHLRETHTEINHVREDVVVDSAEANAIRNRFPKSAGGMVRVPKVL